MVIRDARTDDGDAMLALMPRLAAFDIPEGREPEHLYQGDRKLLQEWLDGNSANCLVQVAVDESDSVLGFTLAQLRPDALSHAPSAHLEAIAVAEAAEGRGAGRALLGALETNVRKHGAESLTLHVISSNRRARAFYERAGYSAEMLRYIKSLG